MVRLHSFTRAWMISLRRPMLMLRVETFAQGGFALWEVLTSMTDEVQSICRKMEAENAACGATVREIPFWVGTSAAVDGLMTWRSWSGMNTWNILKQNSKFLSGSGSRFEHERCLHFEAVVPGLCLGSMLVSRKLAVPWTVRGTVSYVACRQTVTHVPREGYDGQMKDTSSLKARSTWRGTDKIKKSRSYNNNMDKLGVHEWKIKRCRAISARKACWVCCKNIQAIWLGCANFNPDNLCLMFCIGLHEYQRGLWWSEASLQGSEYLLLPACRSALESLRCRHFVKPRFCHQFGSLIGLQCRYMSMASSQRKLRGSSCQASGLHCHGFLAVFGPWGGFTCMKIIYLVGIIMPCQVTSESNESHDIWYHWYIWYSGCMSECCPTFCPPSRPKHFVQHHVESILPSILFRTTTLVGPWFWTYFDRAQGCQFHPIAKLSDLKYRYLSEDIPTGLCFVSIWEDKWQMGGCVCVRSAWLILIDQTAWTWINFSKTSEAKGLAEILELSTPQIDKANSSGIKTWQDMSVCLSEECRTLSTIFSRKSGNMCTVVLQGCETARACNNAKTDKNRCKNPHLVHCVELFCCCLSNLINRQVNKPCDLVKTQKRDRCKSELCQVFEVFLFLYLSNFQQYMIAFKMFWEQRQKHPLYQVTFAAPTFHPRWFSGARHAETQKCAGRCRKTLDISVLWPKNAETIYMPCQLLYNDIACILTRLALKHLRVLLVKRCQSELVWRPGVVLSKCYVLVGVHRPWNHGGWQNDWQGAIRWIQ